MFRDDSFFREAGLPDMNRMFSGFHDPFGDPYFTGAMARNSIEGAPNRRHQGGPSREVTRHPMMMGGGIMSTRWPFGGMDPFQAMSRNMQMMSSDPNALVHSSTTVMSYSSGGPGTNPKIYQASSSTRRGPDGIKETRKSVRDSESGIQKMAIGHHIGDRSHTIERLHNVHTDSKEQRQYFENLDESDGEEFDKEWTQKTTSLGSVHPSVPSASRRRAIAGTSKPHHHHSQHHKHPPYSHQHQPHPHLPHQQVYKHQSHQHLAHQPQSHQHQAHQHPSHTFQEDEHPLNRMKRTHRPPSLSVDEEDNVDSTTLPLRGPGKQRTHRTKGTPREHGKRHHQNPTL